MKYQQCQGREVVNNCGSNFSVRRKAEVRIYVSARCHAMLTTENGKSKITAALEDISIKFCMEARQSYWGDRRKTF